MANILVMDDEASDRERLIYLTEFLNRCGHEAMIGSPRTLGAGASKRPDLIILDLTNVTRPHELTTPLLAGIGSVGIPVIFYAEQQQELEALRLALAYGTSHVITRPLEMDVVLSTIERALSTPHYDADRRLRAMTELSSRLATEVDPLRLIEGFVNAIPRIACARAAVAGVFDSDTAKFRFWQSAAANSAADTKASWAPGTKALDLILRQGKPFRISNVCGDPAAAGFPAAHPRFYSWLGAPISSPRRVHGFIALIDRTGAGDFSEDDERLVHSLARQVGRIYQNLSPPSETAAQMIGVDQEIAARTETERRLADREEHIRLLLDSTAEAIYGLDIDGRCTFANAACARMLGRADARELIGREMHPLMHHTRKDGAPHSKEDCPIVGAIRRNQRTHLEDEVLWRADGSSFPAECWSHPVLRAGEVMGAVVTFVDITERRELEKQYRRAQQRLRDVIASSPAVLFTLSVDAERVGRITWVSGNMPAVLGYSQESALMPGWWFANAHPEDQQVIEAEIDAELFGRGHYACECRFQHADGSYRWIQSDIRLIRDEAGRAVEAVGAWSDITERKRAEAEHLKLREQLLQAQKLESVGRLAGGVAHDFNNLLTVINGYSDLLMKQLPPHGPLHEMADEIGVAGRRAAELTRQLLLLSRKQVARTSEVNLNDVVHEVSKMLTRVIGEDIRLESRLSPELGSVMADAWQMHQVLMNLAVNARDAMPEGGTVLIETRNVDFDPATCESSGDAPAGAYVELIVSDTGVGMSEETMSHLFEPFFTTKKPGEGTGLGLATIYGIVKGAGGSIWVDSEPEKGTSFKIYMPRVVRRIEPLGAETATAAPLLGTETVLVVEDQEQLLRMTGDVLRGYGYTVLQASTPDEALRQSAAYPGEIHILLTDVVMPQMRGIELALRLKAVRPGIRAIFMSGYGDRFVEPREPAGFYLVKPFSPEALGRTLREAAAAGRATGAVLVIDEDPGIRKLLRNLLASAGYQALEAASGKDALQIADTAKIDLVIADLPESEQRDVITALRRSRPQVKTITMSGSIADPAPRATGYPGAQAAIAKPIEPDQLVPFVARVLAY